MTHDDIDALKQLDAERKSFTGMLYDFVMDLEQSELLTKLYELEHVINKKIEELEGSYNGD